MKECTFTPNISSARKSDNMKKAPKGFVESVARVREAFNRKEEIKKMHQNLGQFNQGLQRADQTRVDGRLVPEPFKFKHSQAQREQKEKQMEDSRLQEEEKDAVDAKKRAIIVASTVKRVQQKKSRLYSLP